MARLELTRFKSKENRHCLLLDCSKYTTQKWIKLTSTVNDIQILLFIDEKAIFFLFDSKDISCYVYIFCQLALQSSLYASLTALHTGPSERIGMWGLVPTNLNIHPTPILGADYDHIINLSPLSFLTFRLHYIYGPLLLCVSSVGPSQLGRMFLFGNKNNAVLGRHYKIIEGVGLGV